MATHDTGAPSTAAPRPTPRPFTPEDFDEPCEDCGAPAGAYDYPRCPSGYTAEDARADAERVAGRH